MSATVIIPTTGGPELDMAIKSVLNQTYEDTMCYVVCDGDKYRGKVKTITDNYLGNKNFKVCFLPENVGAAGFYGHRVYAAFTHLINTDYVLYLDQDCWMHSYHVKQCIDVIESQNLDWAYSLRTICDKDGMTICEDNCESLGLWPSYVGPSHIDTNCYCIKTKIAIAVANAWHGGWGQDRVFLNHLAHNFHRFNCTKDYTVFYRVGGNEGSVTPEFFIKGNEVMKQKYNGEFPWQEKI